MKRIIMILLMVAMIPSIVACHRSNIDGPSETEITSHPILTTIIPDPFYGEKYVYTVEGDYASYIAGKVIDADKIGEKILDASVSAGWMYFPSEEWKIQETLRAEVYLINGIDKNVAVAIKFIDKGDALTTTHYYVIINPAADYSIVDEYFISE